MKAYIKCVNDGLPGNAEKDEALKKVNEELDSEKIYDCRASPNKLLEKMTMKSFDRLFNAIIGHSAQKKSNIHYYKLAKLAGQILFWIKKLCKIKILRKTINIWNKKYFNKK